ncbi:MAG: LytTR family DNA-binding domain-containing protein, partial [Sporomusaceae bacterium]|nr:LytTR family DNA-binding domain-containing protein [Sporomusaceae bacterium]
MLKIAICDDEEVVCAMLKEMVLGHLGELGEACDIKCYANGSQLLQGPFCSDILLLDIQMPGVDGLALAKKLRAEEINCALIFITALAGHVYDAFEVEPIDYLCKPVEAERLKKALNRALRKIEVNDQNYLLVKTMNWCKQIKLSSIYYGEVINRKIYLYTQNGAIDYYGKLEELEKQLDYRFVR